MTAADSPVIDALREEDGRRKRDLLSRLVVAERAGRYRLAPADAEALYTAMLAVAGDKEPFDGLLFRVIWQLLRVAPPHPPLRKMALYMIGQPRMLCRGDAFQHLLAAYPDLRDELLRTHDGDPDPYIQDAIARYHAAERPRSALEHWESALATVPLPHDLAETIPACLAESGEDADMLRWERLDREAGGGTVYGIAAALMRDRRAPQT